MRQRPQFLMAAFARAGHDVYFVDPRESSPRQADGVSIVPSLKWVPPSHVILYVHFAPLVSMFADFDDAVVVYDILDDLAIYDHEETGLPAERRARTHHATIIREADIVVASSPALVETHTAERIDIMLLENGVDVETFGRALPRPAVLEEIQGPIIGFHGAIARWFDFDIMSGVARALPGYQFVIVGPVDEDESSKAAELSTMPNVHLVGVVRSDAIAQYVSAFDVGLIPFVLDDLTRAVSPLKMYEYLACGVPVVATPLPVCVDHPLVRTAATVAEFVRSVEEAMLDAKSVEFRHSARESADAASWGNRIDPLRARLESSGLLRVPS